jgi:PBSX family phage terminase large subunit
MKTIQWKSLSRKQRQILSWWVHPEYKTKIYVELEGAIRSTKTSTGSLSFVMWAMDKFDGEELAFCGKTISACRRNVIRPLKKLLENQSGFKIEDRRSDKEGSHLEITYNNRTNVFWIFGGNDESSQDLIQGITLAGIFFDEVLLMPESFINQGISRLSVDGAVAWFTMNPDAPTHDIYVHNLDPYVNDGKALYIHVTMDDNPGITKETKERISSQWPIGSVWHQRNVLGLRVTAEGAIFPFFNLDPQNGFVIAELPDDFSRWRIAADYGQEHPTAIGLYGYSPKLGSWVLVKEYYATMKTNLELSKDYGEQFLKWDGKDIVPEFVDIDTGGGGLSLLNQLRTDYPELHHKSVIRHAIKENVNAEIGFMASALYTHKFRYYKACERSIKETSNYRWAQKPTGSGKEEPLKVNDDGCDRDRYFWNRVMHNG